MTGEEGVMPKERINAVAGEISDTYELQVGWSRDRDVQVGVETADGRSLLWALFGSDENLHRIGAGVAELVQRATTRADGDLVSEHDKQEFCEALGRAVLNEIESDGAGSYFVSEHGSAFYTGVWTMMDREDCNRTIRVLRRARDQAFGQDE